MSLAAYLDKGASLGPDAPCLTMGERSLTYAEVQDFSRRVAGALVLSGCLTGGGVSVPSLSAGAAPGATGGGGAVASGIIASMNGGLIGAAGARLERSERQPALEASAPTILSTALWRPTSSRVRSTVPSRSKAAAAWTAPVCANNP